MNNEVLTDKDLIDQALATVVSSGTSQHDSSVKDAVSTQAEVKLQLARERELQLDKDVLVAEMSAFVGGAALVSTPTAGSFAGLGGATAGFGLAISKSEAVEEAGKTHMVGLAAVGGMAAGVAAQTGNAPAMIGIAVPVAAVGIYQTGEIVVEDIQSQREAGRMKASQNVLEMALKEQPSAIVSAADRVLEIVARQSAVSGESVSDRMDSARVLLAEQIKSGAFARDLESHERELKDTRPEPQL